MNLQNFTVFVAFLASLLSISVAAPWKPWEGRVTSLKSAHYEVTLEKLTMQVNLIETRLGDTIDKLQKESERVKRIDAMYREEGDPSIEGLLSRNRLLRETFSSIQRYLHVAIISLGDYCFQHRKDELTKSDFGILKENTIMLTQTATMLYKKMMDSRVGQDLLSGYDDYEDELLAFLNDLYLFLHSAKFQLKGFIPYRQEAVVSIDKLQKIVKDELQGPLANANDEVILKAIRKLLFL